MTSLFIDQAKFAGNRSHEFRNYFSTAWESDEHGGSLPSLKRNVRLKILLWSTRKGVCGLGGMSQVGGNNWLQFDLFQGGAKRARHSHERAVQEKVAVVLIAVLFNQTSSRDLSLGDLTFGWKETLLKRFNKSARRHRLAHKRKLQMRRGDLRLGSQELL
jgi:hypothetical protein